MSGVEGARCDEQLRFARDIASAGPASSNVYSFSCRENRAFGFGPIEAEFLYKYIAARRPRSIIQIGAGVSTSVILQGARAAAYTPTVCCIDPYPTEFLKQLSAIKTIELLALPAEEINSTIVSRLSKGDLFFVDSTHTLGPAGEVTRLILEWLPQLSPGVHVHFHDIYFPYDYNPNILQSALFFPHETALLHAFLCLNHSFRILCSLSMLHHYRQSELMELFSRFSPMQMDDGVMIKDGHFPSSIYIERMDA